MTWTITTILKTVRIKSQDLVLIQAKALSVFMSGFAQLPIIEPMFAEIVVLGEESANPHNRRPFTQSQGVREPVVCFSHDEGIQISKLVKDLPCLRFCIHNSAPHSSLSTLNVRGFAEICFQISCV